jgi:hypothetical protein
VLRAVCAAESGVRGPEALVDVRPAALHQVLFASLVRRVVPAQVAPHGASQSGRATADGMAPSDT